MSLGRLPQTFAGRDLPFSSRFSGCAVTYFMPYLIVGIWVAIASLMRLWHVNAKAIQSGTFVGIVQVGALITLLWPVWVFAWGLSCILRAKKK